MTTYEGSGPSPLPSSRYGALGPWSAVTLRGMLTAALKCEETMGWIREQRGAALIEWALLVILIAIVALVTVKFAGAQHSQLWSEIGQSLANA
jgi:Flp pilus assembly pilin Flp